MRRYPYVDADTPCHVEVCVDRDSGPLSRWHWHAYFHQKPGGNRVTIAMGRAISEESAHRRGREAVAKARAYTAAQEVRRLEESNRHDARARRYPPSSRSY